MKGIAFLLSLLTCIATGDRPVRLVVTPDRFQYYGEKAISFDCEGAETRDEWVVMRHSTLEDIISECGSHWGRRSSQHLCRVSMSVYWDSGVYWCQSHSGEVSEFRNFTVSRNQIIITPDPATPSVGANMTLSCSHKYRPLEEGPVYFYKGKSLIAKCPTGTTSVTIGDISKEHEGFYRCGSSETELSPVGWISVDTEEYTNDTGSIDYISSDTSSPCEIYSPVTEKPTTTQMPTTQMTMNNTEMAMNNTETVASPPQSKGLSPPKEDEYDFSPYDIMYGFIGLVFGIILVVVALLVFKIYTTGPQTITEESMTPCMSRRAVVESIELF